MKILLSLLVLCLASSTIADFDHLEITYGGHQFTTDWYTALAKTTTGNVVCSPFSAHEVLSMAWQGARGKTSIDFATTLYINLPTVAANGYKRVLQNLNNVENSPLSIANRLYLSKGKELLPKFNNVLSTNFASDVEQLDFSNNVESSQTINDWVEQNTKGKIKDIISPNDLDSTTSLVLVNAIYFKGIWKNSYNKSRTGREPFYVNEHDTVDVDMMHITERFGYKEDDKLDAKILEIPYQNEDFSLVIILPNEKDGIKALEEKLKNVVVRELTEGLDDYTVFVTLPKFSLSTTIDLKDSLTQLGLGEIFDKNNANFRGMNRDEGLYVSKVVQKAFIEVDDDSVPPFAAAGLPIFRPITVRPKDFRADHPFLFMIKGQKHALFFGKLTEF